MGSRKNAKCKKKCNSCDLLVPNELLSALLSWSQREEIRKMDLSITSKITRFICPSVLPTTSIPETKDGKTKECEERVCTVAVANLLPSSRVNNLVPTNSILYGTSYCQVLAFFNLVLDLSNKDLLRLQNKYCIDYPWAVKYNADRLGNNKRQQYFPVMIVFVKTAKELSFWIKRAAVWGLTPSIRSGAHSYENFGSSGSIILDLSYLTLACGKQIVVNRKTRTVEVSPGVRLGPLYAAAEAKGVQIVGGICPSVCAGGLVLGGGISFFIRERGYSLDSLLEADIVLASGEIVTASPTRHPELFRAIKGAGWAGLGAISRYKLQGYKAQKLVFYTYQFDAATQGARLLEQMQKMFDTAPERLSAILGSVAAGPNAIFLVQGVYRPTSTKKKKCGCSVEPSEEEAIAEFQAVIDQFLFSQLSPPIAPGVSAVLYLKWTEIDTALGFLAPFLPLYKARSLYVKNNIIHAPQLQLLINELLAPPTELWGNLIMGQQFFIFGGRVNEIPPTSSMMTARQGTICWSQMSTYYDNPNDEAKAFDFENTIYNTFLSIGGTTFADPNCPDLLLGPQYPELYWNDVPFLIAVRQKYDPNGLFTFPQSIPPNQP